MAVEYMPRVLLENKFLIVHVKAYLTGLNEVVVVNVNGDVGLLTKAAN